MTTIKVPDRYCKIGHEQLEEIFEQPESRQKIIEYLWKITLQQAKNFDVSQKTFFFYLLYEFMTDWDYCRCVPSLIQQWKGKNFFWDHPNLTDLNYDIQEQDNFILAPPEIEEGVLECQRCHSRKTFSFSKQTRRSDESATVFVRCSQCQHSFRL